MSWIRFGIFTLGLLLICTASATTREIERRTDGQGTIHITTPKPDKATDKATDESTDEAAGKSADKFIYRSDEIGKGSRPRSRRPIDPYSSFFGSPSKVRPSPYVDPPPKPDIGTPSPPPVATPVLKSPPAQPEKPPLPEPLK